MSDLDRLYQLRGKVELAYWQLDALNHEQANAIYDLVGFWGILDRDQAESALNCYRDALDKHAADVL